MSEWFIFWLIGCMFKVIIIFFNRYREFRLYILLLLLFLFLILWLILFITCLSSSSYSKSNSLSSVVIIPVLYLPYAFKSTNPIRDAVGISHLHRLPSNEDEKITLDSGEKDNNFISPLCPISLLTIYAPAGVTISYNYDIILFEDKDYS